MFPMMPAQGSKEERRLIKIYQSLAEADQLTLFRFAEFLQAQSPKASADANIQESEEKSIPAEPLDIPRPDDESVIKAIKRLTKNYPMVDKETILHPISGLMTSHILQGRGASEVIDELEDLFLKEYEKLRAG